MRASRLAFVIAVGRLATAESASSPLRWSMLAGVAAGLAVASKETSAIVLPSALASATMAWWSLGNLIGPRLAGAQWRTAGLVGVAAAAAVGALFYSSFLANPTGILDPLRAAGTYVDRAVDPTAHVQPVALLPGPARLVVVGRLDVDRGGGARARSDWCCLGSCTFWARYLTGYVVITTAIFSAIPYKTPWNLLPFYLGAIVLAGIGFSTLIQVTAPRSLRAVLVAVLTIASVHLGWQAWRASVIYSSDPRNPYVYAHTVPDAVRMATRIRDLAALHPDGARMQVLGDRATARAVAAPVVSPGDAQRRLLVGPGRRGSRAVAGHRLRDGLHRMARHRPWRALMSRSSSASGPTCCWRSISTERCGSASWPGWRRRP